MEETLRLILSGGYVRIHGVPFVLIGLKDLPLSVIADDFDIDEASQIESLRSELSHTDS